MTSRLTGRGGSRSSRYARRDAVTRQRRARKAVGGRYFVQRVVNHRRKRRRPRCAQTGDDREVIARRSAMRAGSRRVVPCRPTGRYGAEGLQCQPACRTVSVPGDEFPSGRARSRPEAPPRAERREFPVPPDVLGAFVLPKTASRTGHGCNGHPAFRAPSHEGGNAAYPGRKCVAAMRTHITTLPWLFEI
jgi:hypothetical protein